ncbi:MAG: ATP-binding cassette domain-containing protein [Litorivicinaceae bacterium]
MLTITNLDLSYPGDEPLATISWQVERGDQIALLGRSGTGKSTLLAAIIEGSPAIIKESERIAYLSQQPALLPWATVIENVLLGFKLRGDTQSSDTTEKALNLLGQVELGTHAHRQVALLSGGQKARVALARVLLEQSDLVLLDEPFAGLDRSTRIQMAALCQTLLASKTVILVTHDPRDAQDWLDTAMVLTTESIKGPYRLNEFASDRALIQALDGDL